MVIRKRNRSAGAFSVLVEILENRVVLSAAFDITGLTALRNDAAFSQISGAGVGIAVLDTGVDAANPDLTPNVVAFYNAVEDPVSTTDVSPSNAVDNDGHGTHVSGIAASSDPSIGVAYKADLIDIKVIADSGESQLGGDPLLRGLEWVAANYQTYNIKVVNMSLGESGVNDNTVTSADAADAEAVEIKALQKLGITVVTASGNSYANDPTPGESFPAVVSTIGVANTWATTGQASDFGVPYGESGDQYYAIDTSATPDTLASTSQRSTLGNQLAAPGEDIYSDWNGTLDSSNGSDLLHNTLSGTSMATPFISGVVALMQDAAKYFGGHYISDPNEILQILDETADTIVDSNNPNNSRYNSLNGATTNLPETGLSFKRVDVLKAIEKVEQVVTGGSITTGPAPGPDTDNTAATATPVNSIDGTTVFTFSGSIGTDGLVEVGDNDVDLYKLDVISPGQMTFTLSNPTSGTAFAASLRLFDSSGNIVSSTTGTAGAYPTLVTTGALAVGTYYLGISSVGNQSYTINGTGAANGGAPGDYSLQIQLVNPDPNGTIQGAVAVDLTEPNQILTDPNTGADFTAVLEQGELGSDPPPTGSTTRITVPSDVDMFEVTAPDNGTLTLTTTSSPFSGDRTFLEVFDSTGASISTATGTNSQNSLSLTLTSGATYYVAVTIPGNSGFNPTNPFLGRLADGTPSDQAYNLYLSFDNGDVDGTALNPTSAAIGTPVNADIGTDNGVMVGSDGSKDVDWYTYTANQSGLFDITAQSTTNGFTPVVTLWEYTDGDSSIVKVADTSSSTLFASSASAFAASTPASSTAAGSAQLAVQVGAGESFFVAITGQGNSSFNWYALASGGGGSTGAYTLSSQLQSLTTLKTVSDNSINNGTPETITAGTTVNADIGADGDLVVGPTDVDMYKYVAAANGAIDVRTFTNQEGDADTVLRVFNSSGTQLASNDNVNSSTTASEVTFAVTKGQIYYIGVDGAGTGAMSYNPLTGANAGSGSTGKYSLLLTLSTPGFSVNTPAAISATTGGAIVFTVTLDQSLTASATVDFATSDGTAIAGTDYTAQSGTLTFPAGTTSQTISVPVLTSTTVSSGTRSFTLTLSSASGAAIDTATSAGVIDEGSTITPVISIATPAPISGASAASLVFNVTLSAASATTTTVNYATSDDTATAGADYTAESGTLTFAPGVTTQTISVPVLLNSSATTGTATFTLTLSGAENATIGTAAATGAINDQAITLPSLSISTPAPAINYTGRVLTFNVSLSQASISPVTVDFTTADDSAAAGLDYTTESGTLTFAAGVLSQTISVPVLMNSSAPTGTVTFTVTLANPSGATLATSSATGTIDDVPVTATSFSAGNPGKYTGSAGRPVELLLSGPGSGTAVFVNGAADPSQITLTGTTGNSSFHIHGANATVGDITVTGSLFSIIGSSVSLNGGLTISGSLAKLTLGTAAGGSGGSTISIGAAGAATIVTLGSVSNESVSAAGAIAVLKVNDWLETAGASGGITATSIGALTSNGDFAASIAAGSLGIVKIRGSLNAGTWAITHGEANVSVNGAAESGWSATFGGNVDVMRLGSDAAAITARSIDRLAIAGNMSSATLTLTGTGNTLTALNVGQTVTGSQILASGSIGRVTVGAFLDSDLFAGVSSSVTSLPTSPTDFVSNDSIVSFSVTGKQSPYSFSNSNIAAQSIGKVILARVNPSNGGNAFGVATTHLDSFTHRGVLKWTKKQPASSLVADGDLTVTLFS